MSKTTESVSRAVRERKQTASANESTLPTIAAKSTYLIYGNHMARKKGPVAAFEALPDAEKERIWREIDSLTSQQIAEKSRPLNAEERELWKKFKRKAGRPRIGKGVNG